MEQHSSCIIPLLTNPVSKKHANKGTELYLKRVGCTLAATLGVSHRTYSEHAQGQSDTLNLKTSSIKGDFIRIK